MLDTSVRIQHSESHKGRWQSFGKGKWGPYEVDNGKLTSSFEPTKIKKSKGGDQIYALGTISRLLKQDQLTAVTTDVLRLEFFLNRSNKSFNYGDVDLFAGISEQKISSLGLDGFILDLQRGMIILRNYLAQSTEEPFRTVVSEIAEEDPEEMILQDAWHIHCCIRSSCRFFVTMDFNLISRIDRVESLDLRSKLKAMVVSPRQLCSALRMPERTDQELKNYASEISPFPIR